MVMLPYIKYENMKRLILDCSVSIVGNQVGVKIYHEKDEFDIKETYSFELSDYLREKGDMDVYRPGSGCVDTTLEGCIYKLNIYKNRFKNVDKIENNPNF